MRFASTTIALVLAASATGCVHGWAPTSTTAVSTQAIIDADTVEHTVGEPVRVSRAGRPLALLEPGDRLRVSGDALVLLPRAGAEVVVEGPDLMLEASRVDHGLTALNTVVWSLSATATAIGSAILTLFFGLTAGDAVE